MSYGSYACHATIITEEALYKVTQELKIPMFTVDEIDSLYSKLEDQLDDMEREFCEIINTYSLNFLPDDVEQAVYNKAEKLIDFITAIEEYTGLCLELNYEGETGGADDDINEEFYWVVLNAHQYTPPAEQYKHYLTEANWVIYG